MSLCTLFDTLIYSIFFRFKVHGDIFFFPFLFFATTNLSIQPLWQIPTLSHLCFVKIIHAFGIFSCTYKRKRKCFLFKTLSRVTALHLGTVRRDKLQTSIDAKLAISHYCSPSYFLVLINYFILLKYFSVYSTSCICVTSQLVSISML